MRTVPLPFRKLVRQLSAALLALTLAACTEAPQLAPIPADGVILSFGDSLTFGTGAARGQSYPDQLEKLTGRRVINAGVPGELSAAGAARLPGVLDQHRPDLLVLCHGGNDILRGYASATTQRNLTRMVQTARARGVEVVLIGVPERSLLLHAAPFYDEVARHSQVPLENQIMAEVLGERDLKSDRIHPNAQGYLRIAEAIHRLLQARGALL